MLRITIPEREWYNEVTEEFEHSHECTLQLEHSLLSLSKWESKWKKPFYKTVESMTYEESIDYIRCMTITQNVDPKMYFNLTKKNVDDVLAYIEDSMTATWFTKEEEKRSKIQRRTITAELIYYWMTVYHIPFECQKWHLNRLITLIEVCNRESNPPEPLKGSALAKHNSALNAARRKKFKSRG